MTQFLFYLMLTLKWMVAICILALIISAPVLIAIKTGKDKTTACAVRVAALTLWWTGIGWLIALFWAAKK